jgi:hypothetical protein
MEIRKSPFKVDKIEDNPDAYALRRTEISLSVEALFNDRNILVSGPRGIGKSSFAKQMQILYQGDFRLLDRCGIEVKFPNYLCIYYACDENSTLSSLALDIVHRIEQECLLLKSFETSKKKKFTAELDLKFIKTSLETEISSNKPASIVTHFINGLRVINSSLIKYTNYAGINIFLDELDRLPIEINFGHFIKLVHEYFNQDGISNTNFIFVGQRGIYSRLLSEDGSIERLVRHIPISKIDVDESNHILEFAQYHAKPSFEINEKAREIILKLSAGFPYIIHLIGDSAFHEMEYPDYMDIQDVLAGLRKILTSDKNEKYLERLSGLNRDERIVLASLAIYSSNEIPMKIPLNWIPDHLVGALTSEKDANKVLKELSEDGVLIINNEEKYAQFNDELFRVFMSLRRLNDLEKQLDEEAEVDKEDYKLTSYEANEIEDTLDYIQSSNMNKAWDIDNYDELMKF